MGNNRTARRTACLPSLVLAAVGCALGYASRVDAAQFDFNVGFRSEMTDNPSRIPNEREARSDVVNIISAQALFVDYSNTLIARIVAGSNYSDYYRDTFDTQTNSTLDAYVEAFLVERTFSWVAADGFRQVVVDPLAPDTPDNRADSNSWMTGPNAYLRISAVDTVVIEGRYGGVRVDEPRIVNWRDGYAARWQHKMSHLRRCR